FASLEKWWRCFACRQTWGQPPASKHSGTNCSTRALLLGCSALMRCPALQGRDMQRHSTRASEESPACRQKEERRHARLTFHQLDDLLLLDEATTDRQTQTDAHP